MRCLVWILCAIGSVMSQTIPHTPTVAILKIQGREGASYSLTRDETIFMSSAIRSQASQIWGNQVEFLSEDQYRVLLNGYADSCLDVNCFAKEAQNVGVDFVVLPGIGLSFGQLAFRIDIASSKSIWGSRVAMSDTTELGKNQLGKQIIVLASELFHDMHKRMLREKAERGLGMMDSNSLLMDPVSAGDSTLHGKSNAPTLDTTGKINLSIPNDTIEKISSILPMQPLLEKPKPLSKKRKWALALWGGSLGFAGFAMGANEQAKAYASDYDQWRMAFEKNPNQPIADVLQDTYDHLNRWNLLRNSGYSLSLISLVAGAVLWFYPEEP